MKSANLILLALLATLTSHCKKDPPPAAAVPPAPVAVGAPGRMLITLKVDGDVDKAVGVVRRRIDAMRRNELAPLATDPTVTAAGPNQISIEVPLAPGAPCQSEEAARWLDSVSRTVSRNGRLGFHRVPPKDAGRLKDLIDATGSAKGVGLTETGQWQVRMEGSLEDARALASRLSAPAGTTVLAQAGWSGGAELLVVLSDPALTGTALRSADVQIDEQWSEPRVALGLTDEGGAAFGTLTEDIVGEPLAIVFEGELVSAPRVQERIGGGRAVITLGRGSSPDATMREARELASILAAGAFSAPVELLNSRLTCE